MPEVRLVSSLDDKLGIARKNKIPWYLPGDRMYWRGLIHKGPVVMGRNTLAANGSKPYGIGKNFVITREDEKIEGVEAIRDGESFFQNLKQDIWVAGGSQIFALAMPYATHLYLTRVEGDFNCDIFFPEFEGTFQLKSEEPEITENGITFRYQIWERKT